MADWLNPALVFFEGHELDYLKWLAVQKPDTETGGDIFGYWRDKRNAVVDLVLGPGKNCQRTETSFHQDEKYSKRVGRYLTRRVKNIDRIGRWESYHQLGRRTEPRKVDQSEILRNQTHGDKFVLFIANIEAREVKVGSFIFKKQKMRKGVIEPQTGSPNVITEIRGEAMKFRDMTLGAEDKQDWATFARNKGLPTGIEGMFMGPSCMSRCSIL